MDKWKPFGVAFILLAMVHNLDVYGSKNEEI